MKSYEPSRATKVMRERQEITRQILDRAEQIGASPADASEAIDIANRLIDSREATR